MAKRIFYISNRDLLQGKARADAIVIIQTCYALARQGNDVTLITPSYVETRNIPDTEIWKHFDIPPGIFRHIRLPSHLDEGRSPFRTRISKFFYHLLYSFVILFITVKERSGNVVLISRDVISSYPYIFVLWPLKWIKKAVFLLELHDPAKGRAQRLLYKLADGVLCTTEITRKKLVSDAGIKSSRIIIVRNGFNPSTYITSDSKQMIRGKLGLPNDKRIVMYTGKVAYPFSEIEMILESAAKLPDVFFVFVGGREGPVSKWNGYCNDRGIKNALFTGFVNPSDIGNYQLAADILMIYYPGNLSVADSVCPTKMVEYMATGNNIISVDFPTIREVLRDGENAYLIPPDKHERLTETIKKVFNEPESSASMAKKAKADSAKYSWDNRALRITEFIEEVQA